MPLHYNIPQRLLNCYTSLTNSQDLPPGQYVIPFEIAIHNLLNQQAPSIYPDVWAGDKNGNGTIDMTGGMANGNDTYLTWESDGACTSDYYKTLPAQGQAAVFGFIGPATPQELAGTWIYAKWDPNSNLEKPVLAWPLTTLLPAQARAWLVSRGAEN